MEQKSKPMLREVKELDEAHRQKEEGKQISNPNPVLPRSSHTFSPHITP